MAKFFVTLTSKAQKLEILLRCLISVFHLFGFFFWTTNKQTKPQWKIKQQNHKQGLSDFPNLLTFELADNFNQNWNKSNVVSACYKCQWNQLFNTEALFNTWVKEEAGRNLSHPVPAPQSTHGCCYNSVCPLPITGCAKTGREWEKGAQKELPEEVKVYDGKEATVGEGWGLPKGECVEQIINHKSLCCNSSWNNL